MIPVYRLLDWFFLLFHLGVVLFNLFGWICPRTRKWNLALLLLTGGSWFLLGIFYGTGYCPLTDWHWHVLEKLGRSDMPDSYMKYILRRATGADLNDRLVDISTAAGFFVALACSLTLNIADYRRKRRAA
jgi:hypothetical protein